MVKIACPPLIICSHGILPLGLPTHQGRQPQWPFYQQWPLYQTSGRNGRFINQKRPNGQISYIWVAACRFHTVPCKEFISGQAELFLARAGKANGRLSRPASRNGRFIKADGRFIKAGNAQLQFYQQWQTYQGQAKGGLIRSAPLRLEGLGSLVINVYKEPYKEVKEPL